MKPPVGLADGAAGQGPQAALFTDGAEIEISRGPAGVCLRLGGRACVPAASRLLRAARDAASARVPVDLDAAAVEWIDGSGLQILLALAVAVRGANQPFSVARPSEPFLCAFRLAGLESELLGRVAAAPKGEGK